MVKETEDRNEVYSFSETVKYKYSDFDKMTSETIRGESFLEVDYFNWNHNFNYSDFQENYIFSCGVGVKSISEFMNKVKQRSDETGSVVVTFNLRVV